MIKKVRLTMLSPFLLLFFSNSYSQNLNYIFKAGEQEYKCFRIPALVTTTQGTVLAFAEARKNDCGDAGDIDLVMKSSFDGGKSWTPLQVIWDDSANTCGNPAPVVDKRTGKIILLASWNLGSDREPKIISGESSDTRRVFVITSADDGKTWSTPEEITKDVKRENWTWYATGPGSGIQIEKGRYKGRLVVACDHIEAVSKKYFSHTIFSDDGGMNWQLGGATPTDKVNESTVAQLPNGNLMLNMRNYSDVRYRQVAISKDGNMTWSTPKADTTLVEPVCQASLIQFKDSKNKTWMAFSNPASKTTRTNMTIRLSRDGGKSWVINKTLYKGPSAYSNMGVLPNGNLACLYEAGPDNAYEGIVFEEVDLKQLLK